MESNEGNYWENKNVLYSIVWRAGKGNKRKMVIRWEKNYFGYKVFPKLPDIYIK